MGIEYRAVIVVGLKRREFEDKEKLEALTYRDTLELIPPYYDGYADAVAGIVVECSPDYAAKELELDNAKVEAAKAEFRKLAGQEGKVYLMPHGW